MSTYLEQRMQQKLIGKKTSKELKETKQAKGNWYKRQIALAPANCENCRCSLRPTMVVNQAAVVAHIVQKAKVPSVAFVDLNRIFLCDKCHGKYDSASSEEIAAMPVFPIAYDRVKTFVHLIPANELRYLPDCYL